MVARRSVAQRLSRSQPALGGFSTLELLLVTGCRRFDTRRKWNLLDEAQW
jgi:hypothetical protein